MPADMVMTNSLHVSAQHLICTYLGLARSKQSAEALLLQNLWQNPSCLSDQLDDEKIIINVLVGGKMAPPVPMPGLVMMKLVTSWWRRALCSDMLRISSFPLRLTTRQSCCNPAGPWGFSHDAF